MDPFFTPADRAAAEQFLVSRIDYERAKEIPYGKRDFKLDRMVRFLARLGNPHIGMNVVHIAGTKGKGSTAAMLAGILTAAGYRTGLYTSPHLHRVEERIQIDAAEVSEEEFVDLVESVRPIVEELDTSAAEESPASHGPTYFEILTAMALVYFADRRVDWAVLEVGLGGRLDSTNVCIPAVSIITSISLDHTRQLGNTLAEIAAEKAGIIKPGVPVVSGVQEDEPRRVIRDVAAQHGCRLVERGIAFDAAYRPDNSHRSFDFDCRIPRREHRLEKVALALPGAHQAANAAVALAAIEELRTQGWDIDEASIRHGLAEVHWPARIEKIADRPSVVLDSAHNVASVEALLGTLQESFPAKRRILVFATTRDKDAHGMLQLLLPQFDAVFLTRYQINPRGIPIEELAQLARQLGATNWQPSASPTDAWNQAKSLASEDDLIVITGSFFIAAELGAEICGKI